MRAATSPTICLSMPLILISVGLAEAKAIPSGGGMSMSWLKPSCRLRLRPLMAAR